MKAHSILKKYFNKKKKSAPGFSIRSLAKQIDISPSFLSRVLSGEKPLPYSLLVKMHSILDLEDEIFELIRSQYVKDISQTQTGNQVEIRSSLEEWDLAEKPAFHILRQWFYLPILECTTLKNYDGSQKMISERLGLSETAVGIALGKWFPLES